MEIGYARGSTREQDLSGQLAELTAAGCAKVYREKASGARRDRAELAKVMKRLLPGDVLVVTRLDRLARSTRDLLNVLASVTERGAGFRSLKDAWADTTTPRGRLMLTQCSVASPNSSANLSAPARATAASDGSSRLGKHPDLVSILVTRPGGRSGVSTGPLRVAD
jgi:DNA invertase Pin-like site-specific DNA recombinase